MIDLTPAARFGLLLVRPSMLVMLAPALGGVYTPPQVKVGLTMLIAFAMVPSVAVPETTGDVGLMLTVARELAIGLSLALVTRALIAGVEFAGHLSGQQIGFSYGATIDPSTGVQHPMLATLYGTLALLTFLAIDGHHMLLRALAESYAGMPIGGGQLNASILASTRQTLALVFTVALRLAAPVVVVMLVIELAIGLISRAAPALSTMVIGFPIRILVGLAVVAVLVGTVPGVVASVVEGTIRLSLETAAAFR